MEVETALAILEDRVALPFQRHFSRHIYVADIPRVDVVHPNAGGNNSINNNNNDSNNNNINSNSNNINNKTSCYPVDTP